MSRLLIASLIGGVLTAVFFILAGLFGGACHCVTPTTVFFPYAAIIVRVLSWDSIGTLLTVVQFPFYAIILANVKRSRSRSLAFLMIFASHAVSTLVGLGI